MWIEIHVKCSGFRLKNPGNFAILISLEYSESFELSMVILHEIIDNCIALSDSIVSYNFENENLFLSNNNKFQIDHWSIAMRTD